MKIKQSSGRGSVSADAVDEGLESDNPLSTTASGNVMSVPVQIAVGDGNMHRAMHTYM